MKRGLVISFIFLCAFGPGVFLAQANELDDVGCKTQLSDYDKSVRLAFAQTFKSLLIQKMNTGELSKKDLLTAPLFKSEGSSFKGIHYVLKGEKVIYFFVAKNRWFGKPPKLLFASLSPGPSAGAGYPRFMVTSNYFFETFGNRGAFNGGPKMEPNLSLGSYGVLKHVPNSTFSLQAYDLVPVEGQASPLHNLAPEEVMKKLLGNPNEETEE